MGQGVNSILCGFMGEGNGHLARGGLIVPELEARGADVQCVVSGRPAHKFKDMEPFGDYIVRTGMSFAKNKDGGVSEWRSALKNFKNAPAIISEVLDLDVRGYDLILTDYEPTVAWAAKMAGKPAVGIGHQYAFNRDVPGASAKLRFGNAVVGPAKVSFGSHWHHFGQKGILPPLVHETQERERDPRKVLVYMPGENPLKLMALFKKFSDYNFKIYAPQVDEVIEEKNVRLAPTSKKDFREDFETCAAYATNCGFESPSEAMAEGVKILTKPMDGQVEQAANAMALKELGYGQVISSLDAEEIGRWLDKGRAVKIVFPDVAAAVADWAMDSDHSQKSADEVATRLWRQTGVLHLDSLG